MAALTEHQLRYLRGRAHPLKPVLLIGQGGLSANVVIEARRALHDHELIKVRVRAAGREDRDRLLAELAAVTEATLVTRIGHVAVLFRPSEKLTRIPLPEP
jgi:RNA-binding protein